MGLIVLPWDVLVGGPYVPGPCAWPMVGVFQSGVEREDGPKPLRVSDWGGLVGSFRQQESEA